MSRNRAIMLVAIATALAGATLLVAGSWWTWIRVLIGIPFVLLLPGEAAMLFVDPDGQLGGFEWFTLCVGVSIAEVSLIAMGLAASVGLGETAAVAAIGTVTLLTLLAAGARAGTRPVRLLQPTRRNSVQRAGMAALALLACTALVLLLSIPHGTDAAHSAQVVQLWGLADKTGGGVRIGVQNVDATSQAYVLRIEQGGRLISQLDVTVPPGADRMFVVKKSATWTNSAPVAAVLTDPRGVVAPRSISVWATE